MEHLTHIEMARNTRSREWVSVCGFCGWISEPSYAISNAKRLGVRHEYEMAENDD